MVVFINALTGTEMLVADDRKEEYLAAGHRLAVNDSAKTEKAETVIEKPKKAIIKKSTDTKKK